MTRGRWSVFALVVLMVCAACGASGAAPSATADRGANAMSFTLSSVEFLDGQPIPSRFTCDGDNVSVPLQWVEPPANTRSFALIADDPDAPSGTYVHWVIYNLPGDARALAQSIPADAILKDGSINGINSSRRSGYAGPCPPSGKHRYFFKLYALDATLALKPGATKDQLLGAMKGHILAQAELMGTYQRK